MPTYDLVVSRLNRTSQFAYGNELRMGHGALLAENDPGSQRVGYDH